MLHPQHFSCYPPLCPCNKNHAAFCNMKNAPHRPTQTGSEIAWRGTRYLASALHGVEKAARYLDGPAIISRSCRSAWSVYTIQPNKPGWLLTI